MKRGNMLQMIVVVMISCERFFFFFVFLFRPYMALFHVSGLAVCGFESLPLCGFFYERIINLRFRELVYGVEGR